MYLIVSLLVLFFILGLLVFIHELGHFIVAKLIGAKVEEFAFGFGPKIIGKKIKGTEYRINWIPLGGYVKIFGEGLTNDIDTKSERVFEVWKVKKLYEITDLKELERRVNITKSLSKKEKEEILAFGKYRIESIKNPESFLNKSIGKRALVLVAGVTMNFLLSVFIFFVYLSLSSFQTDLVNITDYNFVGTTSTVEERPYIANVYNPTLKVEGLENTILWEIDGKRITTAEEFNIFLANNKNVETKVKFIDDKGAYIEKSLILNSDGIDTNFDDEVKGKVVIVSVTNGLPAHEAGLGSGSVILQINSEDVVNVENLLELLDKYQGQTVKIKVFDSEGRENEVNVALRQKEKDGDPVLGAVLSQNEPAYLEFYHLDYSKAKGTSGFFHSINLLGYQVGAIGELIAESFREKSIEPVASGVGSVVTVADQVNSLVKANNFLDLINLAGLVSVALAFMNILPIPLFDGGHLMFLAIEKIKGRRLAPAKEELISKISFIAIVVLSLAIILKDLIVLDWGPRIWGLITGIFK